MAILIGALLGFGLFYLLSRFVAAVTKGGLTLRTILFGLSVFFIAPCALLGVAFVWPDELHLAAIAMSAALILSAVVVFILKGWRKTKGSD